MAFNIFYLMAIIGLVSIIIGTFMISQGKRVKREKIYSLLLVGAFFLTIYSFYIKDLIFIILQISYILIVIYDIIKLRISKK